MSKFDLKIDVTQFCKINYISQIIHRIELEFYREILDTLKFYIVIRVALDIAAAFKKIQFVEKNRISDILFFDEKMSFLKSHHLTL
jgi:hypothetical protein